VEAIDHLDLVVSSLERTLAFSRGGVGRRARTDGWKLVWT
jgi:hypothetical protein